MQFSLRIASVNNLDLPRAHLMRIKSASVSRILTVSNGVFSTSGGSNSNMNWSAPTVIVNNTPFVDHLIKLKSCFSISQIENFDITWWFIWYNRNGVIFRQEN